MSSDDNEMDEIRNVKDSNGTPLSDGDSVTVIKDLKVKGGGGMVVKRGTTVKSIRLTSRDDEVDCKVGGSQIVLRTEFLKKA
jgi:protein PhnA